MIVVAAGTITYLSSFRGVFVFDDIPGILENTTIRSLWPLSRVLSPPSDGSPVQGRPIANLSFALNYAVGKNAVFGYHLLNLTVHLLAGLALLGVVRRTVAETDPARRIADSALGVATAVAVIWTVHPLLTEAVTVVVNRTESLVGMFYLLTLYCVIRGSRAPHPARWYGAAVTLSALGMGTKEVMATAPVIVLAYDAVFLSGSVREATRRRRALYVGLASTWLILGRLLASDRFSRGVAAGLGLGVSPLRYAATQGWAVLHYLRLSFVPHPLVLDYGTWTARTFWQIAPGMAVVVALLSGTALALARAPWLGFLGVWFFGILLPSSSLVPLVAQTVAEKRMYLPLAAVVTLTVVLGRLAWGRVAGSPSSAAVRAVTIRRWLPAAVVTILAGGLAFLTHARNLDYHSALTIWRKNVADVPGSARAHGELAVLLRKAGQLDAAVAEGSKAIELDPTLAAAYYNRGLAYDSGHQLTRALADYAKAVELAPGFAEAYNNRGRILGILGKYQEALADLSRAIELRPGDAQAYVNRGNVNAARGRPVQAVADYTRALAIEPGDPATLRSRAAAHFATGELELAWTDVEACARLGGPVDPAFVEALRRERATRR